MVNCELMRTKMPCHLFAPLLLFSLALTAITQLPSVSWAAQ